MTRINKVKAHWHFQRHLSLQGISGDLFYIKFGAVSEAEFYLWLDCMAEARSANNPAIKANYLNIAGMHRRNIQRAKWLKEWSDNYGRF